MDKALRRSLSESLDAAGKDCPDPSILAAYFDRELPAGEAERWEGHFSGCARCQGQLAILARTEPLVAAQLPEQRISWRRVWTLRWIAPLATAAAAVVLWVVIRPAPPAIPEPQVTVASRQEAPAAEPPTAPKPAAEADKDAVTRRAGAETVPGGKEALAERKAGTDLVDVKNENRGVVATAQSRPEGEARKPRAEGARVQEADEPTQLADRAVPQATVAAPPPEKIEALDTAKKSQAAVAQKQPSEYAAQAATPSRQAQQVATAEAAPSAAVEPTRTKMAAGLQQAPTDRKALMKSRDLQGMVSSPDGRVSWRFGAQGFIEKSTDGGKNWSRLPNPVKADLIAGSAPSEKVCWAIGASGIVLRTTDGARWEEVTSPTPENLSSITARDAWNATVTTTDGKVYVTTDGGQSWREKP